MSRHAWLVLCSLTFCFVYRQVNTNHFNIYGRRKDHRVLCDRIVKLKFQCSSKNVRYNVKVVNIFMCLLDFDDLFIYPKLGSWSSNIFLVLGVYRDCMGGSSAFFYFGDTRYINKHHVIKCGRFLGNYPEKASGKQHEAKLQICVTGWVSVIWDNEAMRQCSSSVTLTWHWPQSCNSCPGFIPDRTA